MPHEQIWMGAIGEIKVIQVNLEWSVECAQCMTDSRMAAILKNLFIFFKN